MNRAQKYFCFLLCVNVCQNGFRFYIIYAITFTVTAQERPNVSAYQACLCYPESNVSLKGMQLFNYRSFGVAIRLYRIEHVNCVVSPGFFFFVPSDLMNCHDSWSSFDKKKIKILICLVCDFSFFPSYFKQFCLLRLPKCNIGI